jgi:ferredoxin-like protein FixX
MYYLKLVELRTIYCPKCKKDILQECGYLLYKENEDSQLIKQFGVHECISCGTVYDEQFHPVEVDYTSM